MSLDIDQLISSSVIQSITTRNLFKILVSVIYATTVMEADMAG